MGNLGLYEVITTQAKNMGGVENWIKAIESDAAKKALMKAGPALVAVGIVAGAGAVKGIDAGKNAWTKYKEGAAAAAEAKEYLRAVVEESNGGPIGRDDAGDES